MSTLREIQEKQLQAMEDLLKTKTRESDRIYLKRSIHDLKAKMNLVKSQRVDGIAETCQAVRVLYKNTRSNNFRPIIN